MMSTAVLFSFLIVIVYVSNVQGCSCMEQTDQQRFCNPAFVIKGKVTGITYVGDNVKYEVENLYSFRFKENSKLIVQSSKDFAMCGMRLEKGKVYLISGYKNQYGAYETSNCSWNQLWTDIPKQTRTALEKGTYAQC